jgi:ABC-type nitrate/sulfonate/bicarbonate transport system substrate-binding protein
MKMSALIVCLTVGLVVVHHGRPQAAQTPGIKPEKAQLEVAIAAFGPLYLPLLVAHEAGYFSKRGINLNISQVSATASAQALISGTVDIYQRGQRSSTPIWVVPT